MTKALTKEDVIKTMQARKLELENAIAAMPTDYVFGWIESSLCVAFNDKGAPHVVSCDKAPSVDELKRRVNKLSVKNGAGFYARAFKRLDMLHGNLASVQLSLDHFNKWGNE